MVAEYGRDSIRPGRVVNTGSLGDGRHLSWLYVIAVTGETVYGVRFDNDSRERSNPGWFGTTLDALSAQSNVSGHPLTVIGWWPTVVADFLAGDGTFPEVTLTPPAAPSDGDMIPRATVIAQMERASQIASEYAENNDLCGEFERCMEAIGLEEFGLRSMRQRERTYALTVEVPVTLRETVTHTVYVDAYDEDDAAERFNDNGGLRAYVYRASEIHSDVDSWDDVDEESTDILEVETA